MKKTYQTGILLIILALPVFIFSFLKFFGKNEFIPLPLLAPEGPALCEAVNPATYKVPPLILETGNGKPFTNANMEGAIYVASAIDPACKDIDCTRLFAALYRVQERFKNNDGVRVLSLMPADSTGGAWKAFKEEQKVSSNWHLATAPLPSLFALAQCDLGIMPSNAFAFSPWVVLIDTQQQIRGRYDATNREEVDRLLTEVALLQLEEDKRAGGGRNIRR